MSSDQEKASPGLWAFVTILVALIGATATIVAALMSSKPPAPLINSSSVTPAAKIEDGTSYYRFYLSNGTYTEAFGTWTYSNGILSEQTSNSPSVRGFIRWIDINHFELTILDNGVPAYTGLKRNYYRQ